MKRTATPFFIAIFMVICFASHSFAAEGRGLSFRSLVDLENLPDAAIELPETRRNGQARAGNSGDWENKSVSTVPDNPGLKHYRWEMARPPDGEFDRIALHRVVNKKGKGPNKPNKKKVILMLPGTWDAGGWSKLTDPAVNPMLYLANNGYDVFTMSYRNSFLPNMASDQFAQFGVDISGTGDWTYGAYREDIKACVDKIKRISKARTIFMSGFSRGTFLMYIYASKHQEDLKGLVTFDGWFKAFPPLVAEARDEAIFNYVVNLFKAGSLPVNPACTNPLCPPQGIMYPMMVEATWDAYDSWQLASVAPHAPNLVGEPLPADFAAVSDFVADDAYNLWGPGAFSNYYDGLIDREVLITAMSEFTRYWPSVQNFESWQLDAWDDVPYFDYDDNEVDLPAIGFLTPFFCPGGVCLNDAIPNKTINEDVTLHYLPDYGHVDIMFGADSLADVKEPLLQWLETHK